MPRFDQTEFQIVSGQSTTRNAATLLGNVVSAFTGDGGTATAIGKAADAITDVMGIDIKIDLNDMRIQVVEKAPTSKNQGG